MNIVCFLFVSYIQSSHISWKVLDFFFKIPALGKLWKITLVMESPGSLISWKVLKNFCHQMLYFKAKMDPILFQLGLHTSLHAGGAHSAPSELLAGFKGF